MKGKAKCNSPQSPRQLVRSLKHSFSANDVVSRNKRQIMSGNSNSGCNVCIGNLDEKVSERVLYDILIQAGRVVDLYIYLETRKLINHKASPLLDMNPKRSPIMPLSFLPAFSLSTIEPSDLLFLGTTKTRKTHP